MNRRLQVGRIDLVDDLRSEVRALAAFEVDRMKMLDGKASSLLSAAGISVTIGFGFGAKAAIEHALAGWWARCFILGVGIALACGVGASICAVSALRVRTVAIVDEDVVLDPDVIAAANHQGSALWRRFMTTHVWQIYRSNTTANQTKAKFVRWGQGAFIAFLVLLVPLFALAVAPAFPK